MKYVLFVFVLSLTRLAWAGDVNGRAECAPVLDLPLAEDFVAQEVLKFLFFIHPIQTQELMIKIKSFEAMLYLIHWSSGFRYPTNAFAYFPSQEGNGNYFPFQNKMVFSIANFLERPEFDDQFAHYIPVTTQRFWAQRGEIREFFSTMNREYRTATGEGVWGLVGHEIRERLTAEMLDGFFSVVPNFSRGTQLAHTPVPRLAEIEIRRQLSPASLAQLNRLKRSLERPTVRARVLAEIEKVYPSILQRRYEFRLFLWNHETQLDEHKLAVNRQKRPEEDLLRLASYLIRDTKLSLKMGSQIETLSANQPRPELNTTVPPDFSLVQAGVRKMASSRFTLDQDGAAEFLRFFDREMPAYLSSLGTRSRLNPQDLTSLFEVRDARAGVAAEQSRLESLIEILELNDLIFAKVLTLLRADAEELPDSALSHARLNLSLRRLTLLRLEDLRPSLTLMRTAAEARYGLNLTQLQSLNEREKMLVDEIIVKASEK